MFHVPNKFRVRRGELASTGRDGNNGAFYIDRFNVMVSDDGGFEHVSVSINGATRTPTWEEMCYIKSVFWDDEDCVIQYHPPKSDYVNCHKYTLHLWRPTDQEIPRPPSIMVGAKP